MVYPPSNFDPALLERSSQLPDVELRLEFAHGYEGQRSTCNNMAYTASGEASFRAALAPAPSPCHKAQALWFCFCCRHEGIPLLPA